jgi:SAM-dependent methyltransferase
MMLREKIKWMLFPGVNLHARLRTRTLPKHFGRPSNGEDRLILDAGCGNGSLAYQAFKLGNRVVGVSIKDEVGRNRILFNQYLGIPESRLQFRDHNLYDIGQFEETVDEIVCTEVMEHIKGDRQVCESFYKLLKPGGVLHICCPNADHPFHKVYPLDPDEKGGHVRPGYTYESYRQLLEPIGFKLSPPIGIGGPLRQSCNVVITGAQEKFGVLAGIASFFALFPFALLDSTKPKIPYSLYVQARKPENAHSGGSN